MTREFGNKTDFDQLRIEVINNSFDKGLKINGSDASPWIKVGLHLRRQGVEITKELLHLIDRSQNTQTPTE